ncbi:hypothetical protein [Natranaerobius thermophilus]|uniref:ATPase n=1 Tax=Natranaerobius thermophilus (strain ATCC BAA-1301 / DSM 18059 / JW/NM-WN-LF) TaxID=457570 RepID=B2A234_NATTJ|nr:hypothetical protein [Natranaerobius thermophilus]ACB84839.1 conserved hypothetical protein [Natranaerobius thermophilus JW/NM-WN-LF]
MNTKIIPYYFAGGNTSQGFYSLFDYILENPDRIYIFKGGPGTGKSTLMKNLAKKFTERAYAVEQIYCASDSNSLDGIMLPKKNKAVIDGTFPHVIDPRSPGAVEEIIDLGKNLNKSNLKINKKTIKSIQNQVKKLFSVSYNYLKQANTTRSRLKTIYGFKLSNKFLHELESFIVSSLNSHRNKLSDPYVHNNLPGKSRYLFASALTPQGYINFLPNILANASHLIAVNDDYYPETDLLFKNVLKELQKQNHRITVFLCGLNPEQIDCIYLPDYGVGCFRSNQYHKFPENEQNNNINFETLNLRNSVDLPSYLSAERQYSLNQYQQLIDKALEKLEEMIEIRQDLESIYINAQNFDYVNEIEDYLLTELNQ